jgi:hypothetical protein
VRSAIYPRIKGTARPDQTLPEDGQKPKELLEKANDRPSFSQAAGCSAGMDLLYNYEEDKTVLTGSHWIWYQIRGDVLIYRCRISGWEI